MLRSLSWRLSSWSALRGRITTHSIRWHLTAWYVVLLAGLLLVFSAGTYAAVYKLLLDNFDELLANQANLIVQTLDVGDRGLTIENTTLRAGRPDDEHLIRLYRADGKLLFDDSPQERANALQEAVAQALAGERERTQIPGREGDMRVLTQPITSGERVVGALQVGLALEDIDDTMKTLLKVMLLLAPAMLLLASGGGLFLANRALAPIDRITRTAQRISAEDLSQRIDMRGPDDELVRLAYTFDAMLARIQGAFEQQRRFAADASHELRTPLTAMIGQIDVALDRPRDAESYRATLATVREQSQRLARLSNDLLFLARSDAQEVRPNHECLDLGYLLPAIVAQVEPLAQAREQRIVLAHDPSLPLCGNEDDLIRLFLNLLDNAIHYTPAGGTITLSARLEETNPRFAASSSLKNQAPSLIIAVSDTGPGIAPEDVPQLFDRFFRANRGRSRAQGGAGLGLSIAQSIVRAHGGQLRVASTVGQGSTFTVILPSAEPAS